MGCAVGIGSRSQLRDAQRQVDALRKQLETKESENVDLRRRVEVLETTPSSAPKTTGSTSDSAPSGVQAEGKDEAVEEDAGTSDDACVAAVSSGAAPAAVPALPELSQGATEPPAIRSPGHLPAIAEDTRFADGFLPGTLPEEEPCEAESDQAVEDDEPSPIHRPSPPGLGAEDVEASAEMDEARGSAAFETEEVQGSAACEDPVPSRPTDSEPSARASGEAVKNSNSWESDASTCAPVQAAMASAPSSICRQCNHEVLELFLDPTDMNQYCEQCWFDYYGQAPTRNELSPLVFVEVIALWLDDQLAQAWSRQLLPGWPPVLPGRMLAPPCEAEVWSNISVRVRRDVVGPHARDQLQGDAGFVGDVLAGRYRVQEAIGEGHFTRAFLAEDLQQGGQVCLKRHRSLSIEALADLMVLGSRLEEVDADCQRFPRLIDAFFDIVCYTVESLVDGANCLAVARSNPGFFTDMEKLGCVASGTLCGLALLDEAGVVHNDVKSDNLIWVEALPGGRPSVRIVDFGCARLDKRLENGRNWSLAEGGAGHLGKWSPEMALRLPITHRGDVWGLAICLCELLCGRFVWRNETDTAEVVLAQSLGLCNLRDGVPSSLLRRSPLDIRLLYTPPPQHFPLRRNVHGRQEVLGPHKWGLEQVLGEGWQETDRVDLGDLLLHALVFDPELRPSAAQLLDECRFATQQYAEEGEAAPEDEQVPLEEAAPADEAALPEEAAPAEEASPPPSEGAAAAAPEPEEDAEHPAAPFGAAD